jgi:hypothetical protein
MLIIVALTSGCIGGFGDLSGFETTMNGDAFCHAHGFDEFAIDGTKYFCMKYDSQNSSVVVQQRRVTKLADGSFAFSLSTGDGNVNT